jgi:hypothetical protein
VSAIQQLQVAATALLLHLKQCLGLLHTNTSSIINFGSNVTLTMNRPIMGQALPEYNWCIKQQVMRPPC